MKQFCKLISIWMLPCVAWSHIDINLLEVSSGNVRKVHTSKKETRQKK